MNFQYKTRDAQGRVASGIEEAASRTALIRGLEERGLVPIVVVPVSSRRQTEKKSAGARPLSRRKKPFWDIVIGRPIKDIDLLMFTRDLLSLAHSGIPIVSGLTDIIGQIRNRHFRYVLEDIRDAIASGSHLSEAFERYPAFFSNFFVNTIRAGEEAGRLEEVLGRMSKTLERDLDTTMTIKNAVRYPIIVLCFLGAAFAMMVTFVIPRIANMFSKFDAELPLPTRFLIALGDFFQNYGTSVLAGMVLFAVLLGMYKRTADGRYHWDLFKFYLPVFGGLFRKLALQRFAQTLQTLYASGVVLPSALEISANSVGNEVMTRAIRKAAEGVKLGKTLSDAFSEQRIFPPLVVRIVMVGERTGDLEDMLGEIIQHYDREINYMTKSLTTLIEPMLTVILGLMILVFALGVFLPLWNVIRLFRQG